MCPTPPPGTDGPDGRLGLGGPPRFEHDENLPLEITDLGRRLLDELRTELPSDNR